MEQENSPFLCIRTSPETINYNCIAWAMEEDFRWWWPDAMGNYYWPEDVPRKEVLDNFIRAFSKFGYEKCSNGQLEVNYKKVAIYINDKNVPSHAARQLPNGRWTSKLGPSFDVEHDFINGWNDLVDIVGKYSFNTLPYGKLGAILRKKI